MPRLALLLALFALARSSFALNPMLARRSIAKFKPGPVPAPVVAQALDAAVLAPCHFLTEPWRFYNVGPQTVEKLCAHNEDKRAAYEAVPGWMVITVATEYGEDGTISTKKGLEDHAAAACAAQNFMLSLAADGVGSKWMTGALGMAPETVLSTIGAPDSERLIGAIWFGFPAKELADDAKAPPRKLGVSGVLTELP